MIRTKKARKMVGIALVVLFYVTFMVVSIGSSVGYLKVLVVFSVVLTFFGLLTLIVGWVDKGE